MGSRRQLDAGPLSVMPTIGGPQRGNLLAGRLQHPAV
jgi:hypothetical protein